MNPLEFNEIGLSPWSSLRRCCQQRFIKNANPSPARHGIFWPQKLFLNICKRYDIFQSPLKTFLFFCFQLVHPCFFLFLQWIFFIVGDVTVKLYYEKFPDVWECSPLRLQADGKSYGSSEERSLFGLLQTLVNMWSFSRCRFLEEDTSSLWYELGVRDVDRKAPNVHLFLCFDRAKVVMVQDVEWVCCSTGG